MRYSGVLISGAVGGLGGIAYVTAGVSMCNFEVGVAGFGFLALAVMISVSGNLCALELRHCCSGSSAHLQTYTAGSIS